jgi:WD40 repeat protein
MGIGRLWGILLLAGWAAGEVILEEVETGGVASFQHAGSTSEVVCHPDGIHILSSSRDNCVRLWELKSGKLVRRFTEPGCGDMWGIRFVNEGKEFLAASSSNKVYRFEVATGKVLMTYSHPDDAYRIALHPDGKHFVATGDGNIAIKWELATGKKIREFIGHKSDVYSAVIVEEGKKLITGSSDDTIKHWDLESGQCLKTLSGKPKYGDIFTLASSPTRKQFAVASDDRFIRVFDSTSLEEVWKTKLGEEGQVVAWSPDGKLVAATSDDKHLYLLNAADGEVVRKIKTVRGAHTPITFSNDSAILISGGDLILHLHDVSTGDRIEPEMGYPDHYSSFDALAIGLEGKRIFTAEGSTLKMRDREDPRASKKVTLPGQISVMALSDDGRLLATGGQQGEIVLWETEGLTKVHQMKGESGFEALDFSESGSRLVAGGQRGAVSVWSVPTEKKIREIKGLRETVNDVAILGGGEQVMTVADDGSLRVWSVTGGRELFSVKVDGDNPEDFVLMNDGRSLLVTGDNNNLLGRVLPKLVKREIKDPEDVERLVEELADEDYRKREEAMRALAEFGREVIPLIEEVKTVNPEVRARLAGVRGVMNGALNQEDFVTLKTFSEEISKVTADPQDRFWVGRLGEGGVARIVVGVIDHEKLGVRVVETLDTAHGCNELVCSPDGSHLGSINADGTITLFRVRVK